MDIYQISQGMKIAEFFFLQKIIFLYFLRHSLRVTQNYPLVDRLLASSFSAATEDQFPCRSCYFRFSLLFFFSANSNDIFENSQNLVSIDQTTCGLFIYFNFIFSRINNIKIYKNEK